MKFAKVKFGQSTELAGVGYSSVGGPERDGVYHSVPAAALEGWHADALKADGLLEVLGEGVAPEKQEEIPDAQVAAFKASGMSEVAWLLLAPVERQALVDAEADRAGRAKANELDAQLAAAKKKNEENAAASQNAGGSGVQTGTAEGSAPAAKTVAKKTAAAKKPKGK